MRKLAGVSLALLMGAGLSLVLRVYPETVSGASGWLRPGEVAKWYHAEGYCSLFDVLSQGFEYSPVMCDASETYRRQPGWLVNYAVLVPAASALAYLVITVLAAVGRYGVRSWRRLVRSRPRRIFAGLASLSLVAHVAYLYPMAVIAAGGARCARLDCWVADMVDVAGHLLLPFTLVNHGVIYGCRWLNGVLVQWTSPHIGFGGVSSRYATLFGAYSFGGWRWEGFCIVLVAAVWVVLIGALCDVVGRLRSLYLARREASAADCNRSGA